jgi:hypothetical protein
MPTDFLICRVEIILDNNDKIIDISVLLYCVCSKIRVSQTYSELSTFVKGICESL